MLLHSMVLYADLWCLYNSDIHSDMHLSLLWFIHYFYWFFCLKAYAENRLVCLFKSGLSCCYVWFIYAQILFCMIYQIQTLQHKQTRDLSLSNRRGLLKKEFWCLQILEECLKNVLLVFYVCLVVFELLIHYLRWSKVNWILIFWKNMSFLKSVKFQPVEMSIQLIVWHLMAFKMCLKNLALFWLCYQTNSTGCFENSTCCFSENLDRILLSCSNLF